MKLLKNEKGLKSSISKKILIGTILICLLALVGCQTSENTINVQGNSELNFEPDQAEVWAGIQITKLTAEEAQSEANKVINDIIPALKQAGINEKDIETEQLSLYEDRRWEEGTSKIVGWRATQTLKIKTQDLTKVGTIVDIAVNNGANQINNINFGLTEAKEQEYKQQALAQATTAAKEKAETIAENLGVKLGKVKTVSESDYYYAPYVRTLEAKAGDMAVAEAAQVLPQDVTITGRISIVYYVK